MQLQVMLVHLLTIQLYPAQIHDSASELLSKEQRATIVRLIAGPIDWISSVSLLMTDVPR